MRVKTNLALIVPFILASLLWGCAGDPPPDPTRAVETQFEAPALESQSEGNSPEEPISEANEEKEAGGSTGVESQLSADVIADVIAVSASGIAGAYQFSVTIHSPDTGCEQYADWWEVLDEDGHLLYRRILTHSHASEQPFARSGGPIAVEANQVVIVRAHMVRAGAQLQGYGGAAFKGSVENGFSETILDPNFAPDLETVEPLPTGCAF